MPRHLGIAVPLSAIHTTQSWGIGEIPNLVPMAEWIASAAGDRLMLLPVGTMAAGQSSPYSASSAMAIDPIYISLAQVPEFELAGGIERLSADDHARLDRAKASDRVRFEDVRAVKQAALDIAFDHFLREEWEQLTTRAGELAGFVSRERWWLDDYALFQACCAEWPGQTWREWPAAIAERRRARQASPLQPGSSTVGARPASPLRILQHQYQQWIAATQWHSAREAMHASGVALFGDLPFMVETHSADVWTRASEFLIDVRVGAPPDSFNADGQDWGLPMYRWDVIHRTNFEWLRQRARRMAALYDGFRVDHLVGFYRTYGRAPGGEKFFLPPDEPTQLWQGEQVMRVFLESGAHVVAEDLGTVPDFVRASLERLGVSGYKVLRWERQWHAPGQPFTPPSEYPSRSVASTSTHDTEPLPVWWDESSWDTRTALVHLLAHAGIGHWDPAAAWSDSLRDGLLTLMCRSSSEELFLPIQDIFGWRDRINTPGTVGDHNWTWRLPWPVDQWAANPTAQERVRMLHL